MTRRARRWPGTTKFSKFRVAKRDASVLNQRCWDDETSMSVTYLFRFYMAEHWDLFFDGVLQSSGAATHDLLAQMWRDFINHSVSLHAQLSQITAIARLCYSIRQLQLSEYTCRWENRIIGWSVTYTGMIGGAVPISTSCNRATSSKTSLCHHQQQTLPWHPRKMAYEEQDKATSLYISYGVHDNYTN